MAEVTKSQTELASHAKKSLIFGIINTVIGQEIPVVGFIFAIIAIAQGAKAKGVEGGGNKAMRIIGTLLGVFTLIGAIAIFVLIIFFIMYFVIIGNGVIQASGGWGELWNSFMEFVKNLGSESTVEEIRLLTSL